MSSAQRGRRLRDHNPSRAATTQNDHEGAATEVVTQRGVLLRSLSDQSPTATGVIVEGTE